MWLIVLYGKVYIGYIFVTKNIFYKIKRGFNKKEQHYLLHIGFILTLNDNTKYMNKYMIDWTINVFKGR